MKTKTTGIIKGMVVRVVHSLHSFIDHLVDYELVDWFIISTNRKTGISKSMTHLFIAGHIDTQSSHLSSKSAHTSIPL